MSIFSPLLVEILSHRFVPQEIFASTELPTTKAEELRHGRNIALNNYELTYALSSEKFHLRVLGLAAGKSVDYTGGPQWDSQIVKH